MYGSPWWPIANALYHVEINAAKHFLPSWPGGDADTRGPVVAAWGVFPGQREDRACCQCASGSRKGGDGDVVGWARGGRGGEWAPEGEGACGGGLVGGLRRGGTGISEVRKSALHGLCAERRLMGCESGRIQLPEQNKDTLVRIGGFKAKREREREPCQMTAEPVQLCFHLRLVSSCSSSERCLGNDYMAARTLRNAGCMHVPGSSQN